MAATDTAATRVAVGIPAWRAGAFIGATLASLLAQSHQNWSAVISIDGDDEGTAAACAPFTADPRVRVIVQERRLGWVGNCAAVLAAGDGDHAMILPHDDLLDPRYLAVLLAHAAAHPEAACIYGDIAVAGTPTLIQPSVCGPPLTRQVTLLAGHLMAVAFRGLVPRAALAAVGPPRDNEVGGFGADTHWLACLARVGDLQRVPLVLYEKRYHAANTHAAWSTWTVERQRRAWLVNCRDLLTEALACAPDPAARRTVVALGVARAMGVYPVPGMFPWLLDLGEAARLALAEEFLTIVWAGAGLGAETDLGPRAIAHHLAAPWRSEVLAAARLAEALAAARADLARAATERAGLAAEVARLTAEAARLGDHLAAERAERARLADEAARLRDSTSWRLTAPLRALADRWRARGG